jgi:catechol 2,3-dioxygenase-like lactoylglutathione lyase family enzyme
MNRIIIAIATLLCCASLSVSDAPKRPRILGIAGVRLYSTDLDAAHIFYYDQVLGSKGTLGDEPVGKGPVPLVIILPSSQILSFSKPVGALPTNLLADITFATDDLEGMKKYLSFHHVPIEKSSAPRKDYFSVLDPEGHRIAFTEGPFSSTRYYGIIHAGFVVNDRAATNHFYKDILGFRPYWHGGMKDDKDDWVAMQVPDGTDWLEYMLNISPDADKHTLGVMNHIALGVPDIQVTKASLIKNGWKPGEEPKLGRDGKWQLNLYDPDDTRVEFMEFTPKEKPCCSEFTGPHPGPKQ